MSDFIAIFDSGVGGISVLREMVRQMPEENFLYYGDSKNAPYGTKSAEQVRDYTLTHVKDFLDRGAKGVGIACNTATAAAVKTLRVMYPELPLVGIEPALKPAVLCKDHPKVLVMATPITIREEKFHNLLELYKDQAEIIPKPCPGLMEFVEAGKMNDPETEAFLRELLAPYMDVDAICLGCTHYPFVRKTIRKIMGDGVGLYDGSEGTARELKRRLKEAGLLKKEGGIPGTVTFENSSGDPAKLALCQQLLYCDM